MGVVNLRGFKAFGSSLFSEHGEAAAFALEQERRALRNTFAELVRESPRDTGRFAASWRIGINAPDTSVAPPGSHGSPTLSLVDAVLARLKLRDKAIISNSLPYARRLAFGWSGQASSGWVGRIAKRGYRRIRGL